MPELKWEKLESALKKFPTLKYVYFALERNKEELGTGNPTNMSMYRTVGKKKANLWGLWLERDSIPEAQLKRENYLSREKSDVRLLVDSNFQFLISTSYDSIEKVLKQYGIKSPFD